MRKISNFSCTKWLQTTLKPPPNCPQLFKKRAQLSLEIFMQPIPPSEFTTFPSGRVWNPPLQYGTTRLPPRRAGACPRRAPFRFAPTQVKTEPPDYFPVGRDAPGAPCRLPGGHSNALTPLTLIIHYSLFILHCPSVQLRTTPILSCRRNPIAPTKTRCFK